MKVGSVVLAIIALSAAARTFSWADENEEPSPPGLARQIGVDFKNVFTTRDNLLIVGAGLGAALMAAPFDQDLAQSGLNSELRGGATLDRVFEAGEYLGGGLLQVGGAFATYGFGKLFSNEGIEGTGRDLIRAQVVTQALTQSIKLATSRERPDGSNQRSFPSGHASGAFATATVLHRRYGWKVGIPAYAVAGYIGTSRLNEGSHYLSDVVFGAAVGIMVGRTVTLEIGKARFAVSPTIPSRGIGVQFMWVGSIGDRE